MDAGASPFSTHRTSGVAVSKVLVPMPPPQSPAEVHQQLTAVLAEGGEIGIGGVENFLRKRQVVIVFFKVKFLYRLGFAGWPVGAEAAGPNGQSA